MFQCLNNHFKPPMFNNFNFFTIISNFCARPENRQYKPVLRIPIRLEHWYSYLNTPVDSKGINIPYTVPVVETRICPSLIFKFKIYFITSNMYSTGTNPKKKSFISKITSYEIDFVTIRSMRIQDPDPHYNQCGSSSLLQTNLVNKHTVSNGAG